MEKMEIGNFKSSPQNGDHGTSHIPQEDCVSSKIPSSKSSNPFLAPVPPRLWCAQRVDGRARSGPAARGSTWEFLSWAKSYHWRNFWWVGILLWKSQQLIGIFHELGQLGLVISQKEGVFIKSLYGFGSWNHQLSTGRTNPQDLFWGSFLTDTRPHVREKRLHWSSNPEPASSCHRPSLFLCMCDCQNCLIIFVWLNQFDQIKLFIGSVQSPIITITHIHQSFFGFHG